ncbi:hypothetical protein LWI29_034279 [Acer saccharum]|uniref:Uncharacterized protein n=1 Tax=Acer saccharum TaxID=4024 RepID=A0AA39SA37_ACESA|nr:hypothetical protein LWI29_034279 [Acer saccharum]
MRVDVVEIPKVEILKEHKLKPPTKSVSKMKGENKVKEPPKVEEKRKPDKRGSRKKEAELSPRKWLGQGTEIENHSSWKGTAGSTPGISISEAQATQRAAEEAAKKRAEDRVARSSRGKAKI